MEGDWGPDGWRLMIRASVKTEDFSPALLAKLKGMTELQAFVGIPEEKDARKHGPIGNATLLYIHTNGSPINHIPARPVIEPAIEASGNRENIAEELGDAARALLNGNPSETKRHLKQAAMEGQNAARGWFTDPRNGWEPNKPETIARKGSDRPLIDTGELLKSIVGIVKGEE